MCRRVVRILSGGEGGMRGCRGCAQRQECRCSLWAWVVRKSDDAACGRWFPTVIDRRYIVRCPDFSRLAPAGFRVSAIASPFL